MMAVKVVFMHLQLYTCARILGITLLFLSGCSKHEDRKSSCLLRLLNQPFEISCVYDLWPSNRVDMVWQKEVRQYYPKSVLHTQSMLCVYMPGKHEKWTRERVGELGIEYYTPKADILLRESNTNCYSHSVSFMLNTENIALLKNLFNNKNFAPISLTEAVKLFPSQVWGAKRYLRMDSEITLNNEIVTDMNIGEKQFIVTIEYEKDIPVSLAISSSEEKQLNIVPKKCFVTQSCGFFDLSELRIPVSWDFRFPDISLDGSMNLVLLREAVANATFSRILTLGILPMGHERIRFLKSTLPPKQSGLYATSDNSIELFTSFASNGREQVRYIYVALGKFHPVLKVKLPECILLPTSIQDCRSKFDCYYECFRQDGVMTFIACEKIGFLFRNDKPEHILYYGSKPRGDEFIIMKNFLDDDCRK